MKADKISDLTVSRLSVYLRCLNELQARGVETVSSQGLADRYNLNSAQIRKDLACFGEFGVRGIGYNIDELRSHITKILGLDMLHRIGVIGAGRLGTALANYDGFSPDNFIVAGLFDIDPAKIGTKLPNSVSVYHVSDFATVARERKIDIAAIAVPARVAESALDAVVAAGVRAVLNFAPRRLKGPPGVVIKQVDLVVSLESLSYSLVNPSSASGGNQATSCVGSTETADT